MNITTKLVFYLIISLIRIGDFVIFVFSGLFSLVKFTFILFINVFKGIFNTTRKIILFIKKPLQTRTFKNKQIKPISVFPQPAGIKIKYFVLGSVFSLFFIFLPLAFYLFLQELPNPHMLAERQIPQTTKIYDRTGTLLHQIYSSQNRTLVPLNKIPKHLREATIAIEDKNFYHHLGFDIPSMVRAFRENVSGRSFQGASTITQQLIKTSVLSNEPTLIRKIKEIILSAWAEQLYSKDEILTMYFNHIPYGGTAWGVQAAAELYFDKNVEDLTLAESAFLAGITSAPTSYSPYGVNPDLWKTRQHEVLRRMVTLGFINEKKATEAKNQKLVFERHQQPMHAPHFVEYVKDVLAKRYGLAQVERGGLTVITSLDLKTQELAEKIVQEEVEKNTYLNLSNGAVVVLDPRNGDILAMVGSRNYDDPNGGNVNVTTSLRQPGSTIKVITYAQALSENFTTATVIEDAPVTYTTPGSPPYSPVNYDGRYMGRVPLRIAFANSLNIPAVKTLNSIGIEDMVRKGKEMGITSWADPQNYGLSITLGAAETTMIDMATVYATLANDGKRIDVNPIIQIKDYRGYIFEQKDNPLGTRVLDPGVAFIISDILADNQARSYAFGPNSILNIPGNFVSVKTGTSDNKRDNWTIGYTDKFVVASWVGNNDNSPMSQNLASGVTGAAPIWNRITTELLKTNPATRPVPPEDVVSKQCFGRWEFFLRGTEENVLCSFRFTSPTPR